MKEEDKVVVSEFSRTVSRGKHKALVSIYRGTLKDDDWICEVIGTDGIPELAGTFISEREALEAALKLLDVQNRR